MPTSALKWIWLSVIIVFADQLSKYYISHVFDLYESVPVVAGLNITYVHNPGAAFSFLSDAGGWQRWFFILVSSGVSLALIIWLYSLPAAKRWQAAALALILGGAAGNLIDRVMFGYVIDFVDVYYRNWHWPAFNVADAAISIGALMLIVEMFWFDRAGQRPDNGDKPRE